MRRLMALSFLVFSASTLFGNRRLARLARVAIGRCLTRTAAAPRPRVVSAATRSFEYGALEDSLLAARRAELAIAQKEVDVYTELARLQKRMTPEELQALISRKLAEAKAGLNDASNLYVSF